MTYKVKDIPGMIKAFENAKSMLQDKFYIDCSLRGVSTFLLLKENKYGEKCIDLIDDSLGNSLTIDVWYKDNSGKSFPKSLKKRNEYNLLWVEKIIEDLKKFESKYCNPMVTISDLEKYQSEYSKKYINR